MISIRAFKRISLIVGMIVVSSIAGCPSDSKITGPEIVGVGQLPQNGIQFSVLGTTDSTLDVVIAWKAPSSSRPIIFYAVQLEGSINSSPPDSLIFSDTVPGKQLADSATIRRALAGDTLFVRAGVRAQNDRGTWGGLGNSPIIRVVIEDLGPGTPDVSIDTIPMSVSVSQIIVRFANALCVGSNCKLIIGDSVQACAILILSNGTTGLATGSPAICEDVYAKWLTEGAA